jgi:hypothetical protein
MKKLLVLFFLFFYVNSYSQITNPPPYELCDYSGAVGIESFNLTSMISFMINVMNPATTQVSFYETLTDSQSNTNAIADPANYSNITPFSQIIYVRVTDTANSQVYYTTMNLIVLPAPIANPATLTFCDPMELVIYDLNAANNQITGGDPGNTVTYFETLIDAQIQANTIISPYIPTVNPGTQTLYARVTNTTNYCSSITTLTLQTNICDTTCHVPSAIAVSNVTDSTFTVNWTNNGGSGIFTRVVVLPLGEPISATSQYIDILNPQTLTTITGLSPDGCYSVYVKRYCDVNNFSEWSAPVSVCMQNCANSGDCTEALILNAFLDSNNNGIKDSGEVNFNNGNFVYQINDSGTNLYGTSYQGSYYIFDSNPANSYDISFTINPELSNYYASAVTYTNITLPDGSGAHYLYFPITTTQPYTDAVTYLYNQNNPRPGFIYTVNITYINFGPDTIANGTLTFTKDPNLSISSVSQTGIVNTPTGFTYTFTNLAHGEYRHILVNLLVPSIPTVTLGQLVTNAVAIETTYNDANISNNYSSFTQSIVGSYDPNDKSESHGGKIGLDTFTNNDYLYYTIRFENTGNASTEFIRVEDVLDNQLDETTFEMLNASHSVNTKRIGNQLTWHFYSTHLPPTSVNPENSQGYVYFKIKPKAGYAIGDIIPNTAEIFFDFNPPIVTNTFNTEFVPFLGNSVFNTSNFEMYPNPTTNFVTIAINNSVEKISKVSIYDVSGKRIYTSNNTTLGPITIDVSRFDKGIYLVELVSDQNFKVSKKLLIK